MNTSDSLMNTEHNDNGSEENGADNTHMLMTTQSIRERLMQMSEEINSVSSPPETVMSQGQKSNPNETEKAEIDMRSIYIGNVEYSVTADDLQEHFKSCGAINRITIQCNKYTGQPKGYAYIEFKEAEAVEAGVALDESLFHGRQIRVMPKRTNIPGISTTNRYPRGSRGYRGHVGYRGGRGGSYNSFTAFGGVRKPRFPGYRRRGSAYHFG